MKTYALSAYNPEGKLTWVDQPQPSPAAGEVLVKIHAAGINPLDIKLAKGKIKALLSYKLPQTLGHDMAGTITELGEGVSNYAVGDAVFARPSDAHIGTFAPYIALPVADIAPMPKNLSFTEAASLPLVLLTAIQAFTEKARVKPGDRVFIQAGAGGLGSIAIQVAKYLGATVATTVSTKNVELAQELGADVVVDYRTQNYEDHVQGYDIVLDTLGGDELARSMKVLKPGGTVVSVNGSPDADFARQMGKPWLAPLMKLLSFSTKKQAKAAGVTYRFLYMRADGEQLARFTPAIEEGLIKPLVGATLPFEQLAEAMHSAQRGQVKAGKTVVEMGL